MKKIILIFFLCLVVIGCTPEEEPVIDLQHKGTWMFSAKVLEVNDNSLLVKVIYGSSLSEVLVKKYTENDNTTYIFDSENRKMLDFPGDLQKDDKVIIMYNKEATKTSPPQIVATSDIWKLADDAPTDFSDWTFIDSE